MTEILAQAQRMFESYGSAIQSTSDLLGDSFVRAVELIANLESLLIVTGIGKSGLVGQKASATLNSTGTRSVFVHPVEALHGDLGIVTKGTAMLALSKSGSNAETLEFVRQFKNVTSGKVISLSEPDSRLSRSADIELTIPQVPELDEWDLAPTVSSCTSMAICDILAICVQQSKGFTRNDFAQFHPSGALGRRLLLSVSDLMIEGDALPISPFDSNLGHVIYEMSSKGLGLSLLVNESGQYYGMLTDGDIRRLAERHKLDLDMLAKDCYELSRRGSDLPSIQHSSIGPSTKAIDCLEQMKSEQITSLVIHEAGRAIGLVRMQDLVSAGL